MKYAAVLSLVMFIVYVGAAHSEPTPTVSYLINEPASMLDIGMTKLRLQLLHYVAYQTGFAIQGVAPDADATYDWDVLTGVEL